MSERSLLGKVLHLAAGAWVKLVDDTGGAQTMQVSEGAGPPAGQEVLLDDVPVVGLFGFSSNPPVGAEAILSRFFGSRSNSAVIGHNHQASRLKNLQPGDSALYDVRGAYVRLSAGGLVIDAAGLAVQVQNATTVTIIASDKVRFETTRLECTGEVVGNCDTAPVYLTTHPHSDVQPGGGESGGPVPA